MLLTFEVTNYRSFMDTAILYFTKPSFKTNHPTDGDWDSVVNSAVGIWGPNASGKSNLLKALIEMKHAVQNSFSNGSSLNQLWQPHKLSENEPVEFSIDSVVNHVRYRYYLSLGREGVIEEELSVNESRQWKKVIIRTGNKVDFGSSSGVIASARSFIREAASEWSSSVSAWLRAKNPGVFAEGFRRSLNDVKPIFLGQPGGRATSEWTLEILKNNSWRDLSGRLLEIADTGIGKVDLVDKEIPASRREILENIAKLFGKQSDSPEGVRYEVPETEPELELHHNGEVGESFTLPFYDESDGTQTWIDTTVPALFVIAEGGVLVIDEIDSSLHPILVRQLIGLFTSPDINSTGAQLLFTSHDTSLLGNTPAPVVSPDSAWLTEKVDSRSTLYPLDDFKIGETNNIEKRYLQGVYGAVPNVNSTLIAEAFNSLLEEGGRLEVGINIEKADSSLGSKA